MSYRSKMTRPSGNQDKSYPTNDSQARVQSPLPPTLSRELQDTSGKKRKTRLSGNHEMSPVNMASANNGSQAKLAFPVLPRQENQPTKTSVVGQTKKFVPPFSNRTRNSTPRPSNTDFPLHLDPSTFRLSSTTRNLMTSQPTKESQTLNKTRNPLSSPTIAPSREVPQTLLEEGNVVENDVSEDDVGEDDVGEDDADEDDAGEDRVTEDDVTKHRAVPSRLKPKRSRTMKTCDWIGPQNFDEKEDVLIIDSKNNKKVISGTMDPIEIDSLEDGVRLVVPFNHLNQPLRRGGDALIRYLGYMAKQEKYCPIGVLNWRKLDQIYKDAIVRKVREKFVIPPGELFDKAILGRVNKQWKHLKHTFKTSRFKPDTLSRKQMVDMVPLGRPSHGWMTLVDYWLSDHGKNFSSAGKVARTSQSHVHTTGRVSYANKHADIVESKGAVPSQLEFFKLTHTTTEGGFVKNTSSAQFLENANSRVDELLKSSSKSRIEIENDVYHEYMYDENPKRPVGYGFGVRKSQVFGVHAMMRTGHYPTSVTNNSAEIESVNARMSAVNEENQAIRKENQELRSMVSQNNKILFQTIEAIRTGNLSPEFCNSLQSALRMPNYEGTSYANDSGARNESDGPPASSTPSI